MQILELWKSTPFRIAVLNAVASSALVILTTLILYHNFHTLSREHLEHLLADEYTLLKERYASDGLGGLKTELEDSIRAYSDENRVYAILSVNGKVLAGNVSKIPNFDKYAELKPEAFGVKAPYKYIGLSRSLAEFRLVIAIETLAIDRISATLYTTLLWASLAIGAISIFVGGIIGSGVAVRLQDMTKSIDRFANGDTTARIEVTNAGDDIDQLAKQVNEKLERIEQLMAAFGEIGAHIAHDLKTPLSRLYIDLQSVASDCVDDKILYKKLESAARQTENIVEIFESILLLARIENSAGTIATQRVDLTALCKDLAETYEVIAADKDQSIEFEGVTSASAPIRGDRKLLTQMIVNLIENAIRHTPLGSQIRLSVVKDEMNRVAFRIRDNGPGIPESERQRVFERFYRSEQSRTTPGSGLGMALVRAIAESHRAAITLKDACPGLEVRILFPAPP